MKGVFIARTFQTYLKMEEGGGGWTQPKTNPEDFDCFIGT